MKYFFGTITLIAALFLSSTSVALAQSSLSCDGINSTNYAECCTGVAPQGDPNSCSFYSASQQVQQTNNQCSSITDQATYNTCCSNGQQTSQCAAWYANNNAVVPGSIGSTPQSTTPVNSGSSTSYSGGSTTGTTADQQAEATCSAIKFVTLLDIAIWAKCIIAAFVIPGIFTLAFVVFLWGVFKFIRSSEQKDKEESKQFIYMGLIGLFIMTSVWGIINIFGSTLGINSTVPTLQTTSLNINNADKK